MWGARVLFLTWTMYTMTRRTARYRYSYILFNVNKRRILKKCYSFYCVKHVLNVFCSVGEHRSLRKRKTRSWLINLCNHTGLPRKATNVKTHTWALPRVRRKHRQQCRRKYLNIISLSVHGNDVLLRYEAIQLKADRTRSNVSLHSWRWGRFSDVIIPLIIYTTFGIPLLKIKFSMI